MNFVSGKYYKRKDIHNFFGGQERGGISTPLKYQVIFLFTGNIGSKYGYNDYWDYKRNIFYFYGEGQKGDMEFKRGNKAIRDHVDNYKDLYLFEIYKKEKKVKFINQMICIGYEIKNDQNRKKILFKLKPVDEFENDFDDYINIYESKKEKLKNIISEEKEEYSKKEINISYIKRSIATKKYALLRANGKCENCSSTTFKKNNGEVYLEVHHIKKISDYGPDKPNNVIALCPNCHREAHYSKNSQDFNQKLLTIVEKYEKDY